MAASADEICSLAMDVLGHTPFTSFASTSDVHHKAAERAWVSVRDKVLARGRFNSCIKRVNLSTPDLTAPVFGYAYRYPLPTDYLRMIDVGDGAFQPRYKIEAGFLVTDAAAVPIRYVFKQDNVAAYEEALTEALMYAVAARLAYRVTGSVTKSDEVAAMAERALLAAIAIDGAEEDGETFGDSPFLEARFG
jgi:hypothetical protein